MKIIKKISLLTLLLALNTQAEYKKKFFSIFVVEEDIPVHDMLQTIKVLKTDANVTVQELQNLRDLLMMSEMTNPRQQQAREQILNIITIRKNLLLQDQEPKSFFEKILYNGLLFPKSTKSDFYREFSKLIDITKNQDHECDDQLIAMMDRAHK